MRTLAAICREEQQPSQLTGVSVLYCQTSLSPMSTNLRRFRARASRVWRALFEVR